MDVTYLIVGLGNPGRKYKKTRHNLGFTVVDLIARQQNCIFRRRQNYFSAEFFVNQKHIVLMKPMTYMNLSGLAVLRGLKRYKIVLSNLLVVSDDINLPFAKMRIRPKGSPGGHNGLLSIVEHIQSDQFPSLRIGIQPEEKNFDMVDFVLSPFSKQEKAGLDKVIAIAGEVVFEFIHGGIMIAMNKFN